MQFMDGWLLSFGALKNLIQQSRVFILLSLASAGIGVLMLPVVTHLFVQSDYGKYASVQATSTLLAIILSFSIQNLIVIEPNEITARTLTQNYLYLLLIFFLSTLIFLFLLISLFIFGILSFSAVLTSFFILLNCGVVVSVSIARSVTTRNQEYNFQAASQLKSVVLQSVFQVGSGLFQLGYLGLIASFSLSKIYQSLVTLNRFKFKASRSGIEESKRLLRMNFSSFLFPLSLAQLISSVAGSAIYPLLLLVSDSAFVGSFALATQITSVLTILLGSAFSQFFFGKIAESNRYAREIASAVRKAILSLSVISFATFSVLSLSVNFIVPNLLSESWSGVGEIVTILIPWYAANFVSSIVSVSANVMGHSKWILNFTLYESSFRLISLLVMLSLTDWHFALELYSFLGVVNSCFWIFKCLQFSGHARGLSMRYSIAVLLMSLILMVM
jgi:O-antigen/teichoic acid export membrane protein